MFIPDELDEEFELESLSYEREKEKFIKLLLFLNLFSSLLPNFLRHSPYSSPLTFSKFSGAFSKFNKASL